ncbi:Uncharacterised protein [Yersinia pekkanenii]|uniref:Uncharacterized protein n=1 Tax=Yersinia pekkanenii TaxID=1288385 RepID=A0A0T9PK98_9GAMM|nr:Uncharacterised protein [Yersinia pekkanenii]CRY68161.1 Uncharacterised protein [Yersinia pekkanenii]
MVMIGAADDQMKMAGTEASRIPLYIGINDVLR